jgi:hypothetical protein
LDPRVTKHEFTYRIAPNRQGAQRIHPCPLEKREAIEAAFRHFGMI